MQAGPLLWIRLLYFARGFEAYGPQLIMIWHMGVALLRTSWLALFLVAASSHALLLLHGVGAMSPQTEGESGMAMDVMQPFASAGAALWTCFLALFGMAEMPLHALAAGGLGTYALVISVAFVLAGSLLYVNLLVAIMTSSYEKVSTGKLARGRLKEMREWQSEIGGERDGEGGRQDRHSGCMSDNTPRDLRRVLDTV